MPAYTSTGRGALLAVRMVCRYVHLSSFKRSEDRAQSRIQLSAVSSSAYFSSTLFSSSIILINIIIIMHGSTVISVRFPMASRAVCCVYFCVGAIKLKAGLRRMLTTLLRQGNKKYYCPSYWTNRPAAKAAQSRLHDATPRLLSAYPARPVKTQLTDFIFRFKVGSPPIASKDINAKASAKQSIHRLAWCRASVVYFNSSEFASLNKDFAKDI